METNVPNDADSTTQPAPSSVQNKPDTKTEQSEKPTVKTERKKTSKKVAKSKKVTKSKTDTTESKPELATSSEKPELSSSDSLSVKTPIQEKEHTTTEKSENSQQPEKKTYREGRTRNRKTRNQQNRPAPAQQQSSELDNKLISERAWKIFLGEVNEDGVTLIDDKLARELSKRCFRLAEIFSEFEASRTPRNSAPPRHPKQQHRDTNNVDTDNSPAANENEMTKSSDDKEVPLPQSDSKLATVSSEKTELIEKSTEKSQDSEEN
ncbi:hypothetical protein OAB00_02035 [Akkermansiaceae bacterium]|nr:hypothetical protein [Akkermansiaceae bacterium]